MLLHSYSDEFPPISTPGGKVWCGSRFVVRLIGGLMFMGMITLILACGGLSTAESSGGLGLAEPGDDLQAGLVGWPVPPGTVITRGWGCHPFFTGVRGDCPYGWWWHDGIDFAAPPGTPLFAVRDLEILYAGADINSMDCRWITGNQPPYTGFGLYVQGQDAADLVYTYGHVSQFNVVAGQAVPAGTPIASMGSTGCSTAAHLHFRVRRHGLDIDPMTVLQQP